MSWNSLLLILLLGKYSLFFPQVERTPGANSTWEQTANSPVRPSNSSDQDKRDLPNGQLNERSLLQRGKSDQFDFCLQKPALDKKVREERERAMGSSDCHPGWLSSWVRVPARASGGVPIRGRAPSTLPTGR